MTATATSLVRHGYRCEYHVQSPAEANGPQLVSTFNTADADQAIRWIRRSLTTLLLAVDAEDLDRLQHWIDTDHAKALDDLRRGQPCTLITGHADQHLKWTARPAIFLPLVPPSGKPVIRYRLLCSRTYRRSEFE